MNIEMAKAERNCENCVFAQECMDNEMFYGDYYCKLTNEYVDRDFVCEHHRFEDEEVKVE